MIPQRPPTDAALGQRIQRLAEAVVRSGPVFETRVRQQPENAFLNDASSEEHRYYQWMCFCCQHGIDPHRQALIEQAHVEKLSSCPPGYLDLLPADYAELINLLEGNKGSKQNIADLRRWIVDRAHSACAIGVCIKKHALFFAKRAAGPSEEGFTRVLHTLYVVNDVFSQGPSHSIIGPYTSLLAEGPLSTRRVDFPTLWYPHLLPVLRCADQLAALTDQKNKVMKIINLWENKGHFDPQRCAAIMSTLNIPQDPPSPPDPVLMNPRVDLRETEARLSFPSSNQHGNNVPVPQMQGFPSCPPPPPRPLPPGTMLPRPPLPPLPPPPLPPSAQHIPPQPFGFPQSGATPWPTAQPTIDLQKIPVGKLANLIKAHLKSGGAPYNNLDIERIATYANSITVEPGRLEVRLQEFNRKSKQI